MARPPKMREAIDRAAISLFAQKGFAGTSIKNIAKLAGVTEGAIYRYYPSKTAVARIQFVLSVNKFSNYIKSIINTTGQDEREKFLNVIRGCFRYYDLNKDEFAFILLNFHDFREEDLLESENNPVDVMQEYIINFIAKNKLSHTNIPLITGVLIGMVQQVIIMHFYGRLKSNLKDESDVVAMAALRCLDF